MKNYTLLQHQTNTGLYILIDKDGERFTIVTACHPDPANNVNYGVGTVYCPTCELKYDHPSLRRMVEAYKNVWWPFRGHHTKEAWMEHRHDDFIQWASGWTGIPQEDITVELD